jgi:hypothetical protein
VEADLQEQLMKSLVKIGEGEMKQREYYLSKWGYEIENTAINYWSFNEGKGKVQGPGN